MMKIASKQALDFFILVWLVVIFHKKSPVIVTATLFPVKIVVS